jgi:multidrug efflux pump
MIGVTLFGLFLTPLFYVLVRRLAGARGHRGTAAAGEDPSAAKAPGVPELS